MEASFCKGRRSFLEEYYDSLALKYGPGVRKFGRIWRFQCVTRGGNGYCVTIIVNVDTTGGKHCVSKRNVDQVYRFLKGRKYPTFGITDDGVEFAKQQAAMYLCETYEYSGSCGLRLRCPRARKKALIRAAVSTVSQVARLGSDMVLSVGRLDFASLIELPLAVQLCDVIGHTLEAHYGRFRNFFSFRIRNRDVIIELLEDCYGTDVDEIRAYIDVKAFPVDDGLYVALFRAVRFLRTDYAVNLSGRPILLRQGDSRADSGLCSPICDVGFGTRAKSAYETFCLERDLCIEKMGYATGCARLWLPFDGDYSVWVYGVGPPVSAMACCYALALQLVAVSVMTGVEDVAMLLAGMSWRYGIHLVPRFGGLPEMVLTRGYGVVLDEVPFVGTDVVTRAILDATALPRFVAEESGPQHLHVSSAVVDLNLNGVD